ncbi:MAG TPA: SseB family protein, partial [Microbacterium sp.]|nr:SseB family protein [Microbacterium sp.]
RGKGPLTDVVDALAYARVLIPVFAHGEERHVGRHGLEQDAVASTGVVAVQMPDGRAALPVFTDVDAMRLWNPDARPIPAEGPRAALAAVSEEWSSIVINPGMETVLIPRPAVWALGKGDHWRPAVVEGRVDDEVRTAVEQAVTLDHLLKHVDVAPGRGAEVAVVLRLVPGLSKTELDAILGRVQRELSYSDIVAQRLDSLELRLAEAPQY